MWSGAVIDKYKARQLEVGYIKSVNIKRLKRE